MVSSCVIFLYTVRVETPSTLAIAATVIFKDNTGLSKTEKLSIVGKLIGRGSKASAEDIYETMLLLHDDNKKITVAAIAKVLGVSTRTVYRNMTHELTKEKELLNEEI